MKKNIILEVKNLSTSFYYEKKEGKAVDDVSFKINQGEILGIVGESGSGKSVTAMSIMRLIKNSTGKIVSGEVIFNGEDLLKKSDKEMQKIRGKCIGVIFQEPMTSLNPVLTVGQQITETIQQHEKISKEKANQRAKELLEIVQIPFAGARMKEYPHQLSGGMRQRVMIAMAISCNPNLIIADEPTTALDVTIQSQILELFRELRKKLNTSIIIITHDMGILGELADKILVMYAGRAVEYGDTYSILREPQHPYTKALINAIPKLYSNQKTLNAIPGTIPNIYNMPSGCNYHPRCNFAKKICFQQKPVMKVIGEREVSCWYVQGMSTGGDLDGETCGSKES